mgnify:CR=1 FL=1
MIRRPPRSTLDRSSAASDVYKRQVQSAIEQNGYAEISKDDHVADVGDVGATGHYHMPVSYTHLRAHETVLDLVCRLLLEKKKINNKKILPEITLLEDIY